jgi:flagellar biosynthesis protein FliR
MSLRLDIGWLLATVLVSTRIATALAFAPVLGPSQIPATVRVFLALAMGALMVSIAPVPVATADLLATNSFVVLAVAMAQEAIVGLAFAFGFIVAYAATQIAGRALDTQIGFGAAGVLNPATQTFSPLIGSALGMAGIFFFLSLDGHLLLFRALAVSLQAAPPGASYATLVPATLLAHSGKMFTFALALAGPIMFMFLLSDLCMAVFSRSMPQLNVFVLGFAVKIVLGLVGLAASIRFADTILTNLFSDTFAYWNELGIGR